MNFKQNQNAKVIHFGAKNKNGLNFFFSDLKEEFRKVIFMQKTRSFFLYSRLNKKDSKN